MSSSHTYQVRDFAPRLHAFRPGAPCRPSRLAKDGYTFVFVRSSFRGNLKAELSPPRFRPCFLSVQAGAFPYGIARAATPLSKPSRRRSMRAPSAISRKSHSARPPKRGPQRRPHHRLRRSPASRSRTPPHDGRTSPQRSAVSGRVTAICDHAWLPMERQVGSSGQTVSPKLYLAVGISGAIQPFSV